MNSIADIFKKIILSFNVFLKEKLIEYYLIDNYEVIINQKNNFIIENSILKL